MKNLTSKDEYTYTYLERINTQIKYGSCKEGRKVDEHTIEMVGNNDLKTIYEFLKIEFSSSFTLGKKHAFGRGWSLLPIIGDKHNVMIDIYGNTLDDRKWACEEIDKDKQSLPINSKINVKK